MRTAVSLLVLICYSISSAMNADNLPDFLRGRYTGSWAYRTITERLPIILTKVIDLLCRDKESIVKASDLGASEDIKEACSQLSELKSGLQRDKPLSAVLEGSATDLDDWNQALHRAAEHSPLRWFSAPWLLVECYMYRKIKLIMQNTKWLSGYDYFRELKTVALEDSLPAAEMLARDLLEIVDNITRITPQRAKQTFKDFLEVPIVCNSKWLSGYDYFRELKTVALEDSLPAAEMLARDLLEIVDNITRITPQRAKQTFKDFLEVSLWANRNDLSLSAGAAVSQQSGSPLSQLHALSDRILVNHSDAVYLHLQHLSAHTRTVSIDMVLDNAGLELLADFCWADLMTCLGLTSSVTFHLKQLPWFVSDVTPDDFTGTLQRLRTATPALQRLTDRWQQHLDGDRWRWRADAFWTLPLPYSRMPADDPQLYSLLQASDLLVFKGDLNYRKLLADRDWPHDTPLSVALQHFRPAPLVALRTLKADLVCGLSPDHETLVAAEPDWMVSGRWAVVQMCERADIYRHNTQL